ncbi:OmpA family protein [Qipengyuania zhejiangensis]|uniref:OmpA family protein n=1 Tax=Qipengyuania zhejiangensis TaxID=3077782 RepID=UPI002D774742|nr:OmpA family protein [Qipengyuania sp. Z2]
MSVILKSPRSLLLLAMLALPATGTVSAQEMDTSEGEVLTTVYGMPPSDMSGMTQGPEIEGIISARSDNRMQITLPDGSTTVVVISEGTQIKSSGGFLGINRNTLGAESLLNGLPVTVETVQWGDGLLANKIDLKSKDLKTAAMIRSGTNQRFEQQEAATEALRGRMADIDKYNIKGTTNVYFDTGKWKLSPQAESELCTAANQAEAMDNALLLIVGYTDSVGSQDYNQELSEKRAGRVVNYLQQACGWKPWRMLTPTGMAEADPMASNDTAEGKAQNRRVSVNILVSKSVDGM